jgi:hypothetical protein
MPEDKIDFKAESSIKRVFVAAVSSYMTPFKDNLVNELKQNGYEVAQFSGKPEEIADIPQIIEGYDVAIHLLSDGEEITDAHGKGREEQQVLFTVQHLMNQKLIAETGEDLFKVFAWHPKSRSENIFEEERLSRHLHRIQQLEEVEFLRTNFEDFKYYLLKHLEQTDDESFDADHYIKGDRNLNLYFLYDAIDASYAVTFLDYLKKRGFTVLSPQFDGSIMEIRQMHNNCLKNFDLAIIFANKVSSNWVNMKIMDLLKSPGLGREKEIIAKAVFLPEEKVKMCPMANRGFDIVLYDENLAEDQIDAFLNRKLL